MSRGPAFRERWSRWNRELGQGMCYAALYCAVRAAPDGTATFSVEAIFYLLVAGLLLRYGVRLARRDW